MTIKGILKDVGLSIDMNEIIDYGIATAKITEAKWFNCRINLHSGEFKYVPSTTCLITFDGKVLPEEIYVFSFPTKVLPYI